MTMSDLSSKLNSTGQQQLIHWWDELSPDQQSELQAQIESVDFGQIQDLLQNQSGGEQQESPEQKALRAVPPRRLKSLNELQNDAALATRAQAAGEELLRAGKVGVILVAGGQGTRLGFDFPKGMFPIGPVTDRTLFQIMFEQVQARANHSGASVPYFIMTSDATDVETKAYLQGQNYFGMNPDDVYFFKQGTMPAVDAETGKVLLEEKDKICNSPDGHGGMLSALVSSGLFEEMQKRGIEHLYYHQVDNPTAIIADPVFMGLHLLEESDMSTKVVAKVSAEEKMGLLVDVDEQTQIIEYSDMPEEIAAKTDDEGNLCLWAGNTAIHAFRVEFLREIAESAAGLPFHIAHKKVPYLNGEGKRVEPAEPNACKFERFIFDALPLAKNALVLEASRSEEFNPVKNAEGSDSPATSKAALIANAKRMLTAAGAEVAESAEVELSPLYALRAEQLKTRLPSGQTFDGPVVLK